MSEAANILDAARDRGIAQGLPYAGAVTPAEAHALLSTLPNARLVDVRTHAEWAFVGIVPGAELIEWKRYPGMAPNPDFLTQLKAAVDPESVVLFMCRSGARSHDAAQLAAAHGYATALNVLEGFEGDKDGAEHRGSRNGWKAAGLPWVQG
ncbi:rhodanese-like domain-containing protein [Jeongeupia naejangsanensis]|uniref:Rhodanese-like domain-containing protein n=1 Tax=Jeongeupia naejangsanensis TaxID=613195 RepID=A0ABS2BQI8_9NEIS|nr:rhodanese-like domain-containing protein [Jeongeupia naejangsanensis]MBM3117894.1 rhodanese-like domain-containing protein [Jeongeupia naejangsanensis]